MRDLDILGLAADGQPLYAQVTYADAASVAWKRDVGKGHCLLFANAAAVSVEGGITVVPLTLAFETFAASAYGERWLAAASGTPIVLSGTEEP